LLVDFAGLTYAKSSNWSPFLPYGIHGIFGGASLVFFSYIGFDAVTTVAEEMKSPQKVTTFHRQLTFYRTYQEELLDLY
jgi:APA family basic amino acid/polyamine antiporter